MSMTSQPSRVFPATAIHGNPRSVAAISAQACFLILALACAVLASIWSVARSRTRRTVESDGAGPRTWASWSRTAMPAIAVAPSAIAIAVEARTIPRLRCGNVPFTVRAFSSAAVRPSLSATWRSRIPPPWPTRPLPSAVTSRAWSQDVSFIAEDAPIW